MAWEEMSAKSPVQGKALAAEFLGTFFIEFVTAACTVVSANSGLVTGAVGIGFSFTTIGFIMRGASGAHLNPAVTLGVMAADPPLAYEFNKISGFAYIVCQLAGSILGALLCSRVIPLSIDIVDEPATTDSPAIHHKGSVTFMVRGVLSADHGLSVFIFELVCTFALVWVYFATMIDQRSRRRSGGFGPLAIGLGITVGVLAEGPGTGASMSPARTVAPAVAFGIYQHLVAPLLGTMFGGLGAGMLYSYLFLFKPDDISDVYRITAVPGKTEVELYQEGQWQ